MTNARQWLGRYGEDRACEYLVSSGYQILDRNWRGQAGELDIVCSAGPCLVFVEVKTRTSLAQGSPLEAISNVKLGRLRRLAAQWCAEHEFENTQVRIDAIAILVSGGKVTIEHLKQVLS